MVALYPDRINRGVLLNSAKSVMLRRSKAIPGLEVLPRGAFLCEDETRSPGVGR
ncbi:hypothetical protein ACWDWS_20170 [Streptomyces sp. NPDC003328]|uniref:hypothetical protein n=1 Tax=unclassified Streptomyces TaxID=2593676 RepID=UPI0033CAEC37